MKKDVIVDKSEKEKPTAQIANQIINFLKNNSNSIESLEFGEIRIEVKNKSVYRVYVSNSILVKSEDSERKK